MEALELNADVREVTGHRVKHLRRDGLIPAVLYGRDVSSTLLQIGAKELSKVLRQAGTHQLISLKIGSRKPQMTLARDIQRDVIKHDYLHVDFYAVDMAEKVTAQVPLVLVGVSPAVRDEGGVLTQGLDELEIECLPSDLIANVEVAIDGLLNYNDTISVSDLSLPDTITILSDPDSVVAKVEPPRLEEELEALEEEMVEVSVEPELLTEAEEEAAPVEEGEA